MADAVAGSHPEVALKIWRGIVDALIKQVKPKAYAAAAVYLRRMEKVYKRNNRVADWQTLLINLHKTHKAKRRLMDELDNLTGQKLVE